MADEQKAGLIRVQDRREAIIRRLGEGFAGDLIDEETFEQRVVLAHAATDVATLDELVRDLEPVRGPQTTALAPITPRLVAVFGNVERRGPLALPAELEARATFGSALLDLRDAQLQPGVTTLHVNAMFGSVEIIVPPDVAVACDGHAVFGNFSQRRVGRALPEALQRVVDRLVGPTEDEPEPEGDRPLLRIVGRAVFASVEIKIRPRGAKQRQSKALPARAQRALPAKT